VEVGDKVTAGVSVPVGVTVRDGVKDGVPVGGTVEDGVKDGVSVGEPTEDGE